MFQIQQDLFQSFVSQTTGASKTNLLRKKKYLKTLL